MGIGSACAGNRPGRHVTLEHFVITRFCLRDRWLHRRTGLTAFRTMDPLTPRAVDLHLSLLETTCLPRAAVADESGLHLDPAHRP